MAFEPRTTNEKLSHAMVSSNLKSSRDGIGDAEMLAALGMASRKADPGASSALRLSLTHDVGSFNAVSEHAMQYAHRQNDKHGWKMHSDALRAAVSFAITCYLTPTCPTCHGRRYEKIHGSPSLSHRPCNECKGSGMRNIGAKFRAQIKSVLGYLESLEGQLEQAVRRKTRNFVTA